MNSKEEKSNVWIDKDGIINILVSMKNPAENIIDLLEEVKEALFNIGERAKILVDISGSILGHMRSSQLRKGVAKNISEWREKVNFEKAAVFGGDAIRKTITSFVITASGLKKVKVFETKEEAVKWLKKNN